MKAIPFTTPTKILPRHKVNQRSEAIHCKAMKKEIEEDT
jgi:hypothetical protein